MNIVDRMMSYHSGEKGPYVETLDTIGHELIVSSQKVDIIPEQIVEPGDVLPLTIMDMMVKAGWNFGGYSFHQLLSYPKIRSSHAFSLSQPPEFFTYTVKTPPILNADGEVLRTGTLRPAENAVLIHQKFKKSR